MKRISLAAPRTRIGCILGDVLVAAAVVGKEPFVSDQLTMWRKIPAAYFGRIIRIGIPAAIQELVYCGISMVLTRFVTAWGDGAVAVQRVGGQIESLSWMTAQGFGTAINAFTGQNYGAGNFERVKKGYHQAALIMLAISVGLTLISGLVPASLAAKKDPVEALRSE